MALDGTLCTDWSRCTKGCDHAQSEHFQFADSFVGFWIIRVVSVMPPTLRSFPLSVLFEKDAQAGSRLDQACPVEYDLAGFTGHHRVKSQLELVVGEAVGDDRREVHARLQHDRHLVPG